MCRRLCSLLCFSYSIYGILFVEKLPLRDLEMSMELLSVSLVMVVALHGFFLLALVGFMGVVCSLLDCECNSDFNSKMD